MNRCAYCGGALRPEELRPYGEGGALICSPCGHKPEHLEQTQRAIEALVDAYKKAGVSAVMSSPKGLVPVLGGKGGSA